MLTYPLLLRLAHALLLGVSCLTATWATAQIHPKYVLTTDQVRAELMAYAPQGADPGKTVWVGLQLTHQPQWHTYWKNSGDSGLPTSLRWTLPPGVLAGDIAWPTPKKISIGHLANFGYEGTVLLPVPLTITPDFKPALFSPELEVKLQANWLVCKIECVPQEGEFVLRLPVKSSTALNAADFDAAFASMPQPLGGSSSVTVDGQQLQVAVTGLPAALQSQKLDLFPETSEVIETAASWTQAWRGSTWTATVPLATHRSNSPTAMPLVLASGSGAERTSFVTVAAVSGTWLAPTALQPMLPTNAAPLTYTSPPPSFWLALLGALLGGLVLNLMPCVFPVLAIKVMGFARHADDRRGQRISGLAYSAGVVASFVALGALMLALRSAGETLGWGFQLQSPAVVVALAVLFTVMGLNLSGLFEFRQFVPSGLATLEASNPTANAFLTGLLAVVIASPCTAPFMGASLGLALGLPAWQALLIFATLGLGMALPFLVASCSPLLARLLPRPGAWMNTLRRAMAFPMFATVVWLVWVLGQQTSIDGAGALLALLVALAMVIGALGTPSKARLPLVIFSIAILLGTTWVTGQFIFQNPKTNAATLTQDNWQPWAPGKIDQVLATGAPVFVDFTAAWCVTCQYNKTTLNRADVQASFTAKQVTLLRADWTRRDPAISAALAQLGRNGVPVYVLYAPGRAPMMLSEIPSASELLAALAVL